MDRGPLNSTEDMAAQPRHKVADFSLLEQANRCVMCGLCLPHCPTYLKTHAEAESPRGRIALARALAQGDLTLTPRLASHIGTCLDCRACEKACPSGVAYGELIVHTRAFLKKEHGISRHGLIHRLAINALTAGPLSLRVSAGLLRLYQRSGLQRLLRRSGMLRLLGLARLDAALPAVTPVARWREFYPASGGRAGEVALFTGCVANITDRRTLDACIAVLTRMGYDVRVPAGQGCCGSLHWHNGDRDRAEALMRRNLRAFPAASVDAIITSASGCGAMLKEYAVYLTADKSAPAFSDKVKDISQFLTEIAWPRRVPVAPLMKRVAVHDPCTLANVLRQEDKPLELLRRIPGVEIIPLPDNHLCCGAAGTYHLAQPEMAHRLRAGKIEQLVRLKPDILATSNIGCAMFLESGLRAAGLDIEVVHPVVLLEKQLQVTSGK